jgi:hypothetical protein
VCDPLDDSAGKVFRVTWTNDSVVHSAWAPTLCNAGSSVDRELLPLHTPLKHLPPPQEPAHRRPTSGHSTSARCAEAVAEGEKGTAKLQSKGRPTSRHRRTQHRTGASAAGKISKQIKEGWRLLMAALLLPSSGQRSARGYQSLLVHLLLAMSMRQCLRFKGE